MDHLLQQPVHVRRDTTEQVRRCLTKALHGPVLTDKIMIATNAPTGDDDRGGAKVKVAHHLTRTGDTTRIV